MDTSLPVLGQAHNRQAWTYPSFDDVHGMTMQVPGSGQNPRPRTQQPRQPLWLALNAVFGLMDGVAVRHLLDLCPGFLDVALNCVRGGAAASWPAVGCLKSLFAGAGPTVSIEGLSSMVEAGQ